MTLKADPKNANRHSPRGLAAVRASLDQFGAGRPVLVNEDDVLIAGNATYDSWDGPVRVVDCSGDEYVVVVRDDLEPTDPRAVALGYADNRTAQLDRVWDKPAVIHLYDKIDLKSYWRAEEIAEYVLDITPHKEDMREDTSTWQMISISVPLPVKAKWNSVMGSKGERLEEVLRGFDSTGAA